MQYKRINQRVDDEIISTLGQAQEMSPIINMRSDARILIRSVLIEANADILDGGIDLDSVDMLDPIPQGMVDIVAGAGADDERILERLATAILLQEVN